MNKTVSTSKKILRFTGRFLLGLVLFVLAYSLIIFTLSRITVNAEKTTDTAFIPIYIKTNGVHSDIVVPYRNDIKDWSLQLPSANTLREDDDARFLSVGWGDRDFYLHTPTWADLKVSTALKAVSYLGTSVMHTELYTNIIEGASCKKMLVTETQYRNLVSYIEDSFAIGESGQPTYISDSAYGDYVAFYDGKGSYSGAYTCNSWVNQGLKAAGQKAAVWTLTDTGIFCHYE